MSLLRQRPAALRRVAIVTGFNLGDALFCLPMAGVLKKENPGIEVLLVARNYTRPLLEMSEHVSGVIDFDAASADPAILRRADIDAVLNPFPHREFAKVCRSAGIPIRVGNLRRGPY